MRAAREVNCSGASVETASGESPGTAGPPPAGGRSPRAAAGWLAVFVGVTLLGFQMAQWTRWDLRPGGGSAWASRGLNCIAHVFVLGTWTFTWLGFWRCGLRARGGKRLALAIPVLAALLAEAMQFYLPGHVPDAVGLGCNFSGVGLAVLLYRRLAGGDA